jgi:exosortase family protein XrtF
MISKYKPAIFFLLKYIAVYVALNTLYAFYIESNRPDADQVTQIVTQHATGVLHLFDNEVTCQSRLGSIYVPIKKGSETVVEVFEGCNSINVFIVFVAFLVAFRGPFKKFLSFVLVGGVIIYLVNLLRITALYFVALHFPEALYFFHKFLFTGIIYLVVFAMWYYWTVKVKAWQAAQV